MAYCHGLGGVLQRTGERPEEVLGGGTMKQNTVPSCHADRRGHRQRLCLSAGMIAAAGLAACAGPSQPIPVAQEAAQYRENARSYYRPPGPSWDPWGPYVSEASNRFDVPGRWIRAVMHQESSGRSASVSNKGAMGLMQLMPFTYDLMRAQYGLGNDPYEPHDNIMAGTGYIRQMYDVYGSPGFLAAYDAGPGRLDDYLTRNRPLPAETRNYVAAIGPKLAFDSPRQRSQADMMAMNHMAPAYAIARYAGASSNPTLTRSVQLAWVQRDGRGGAGGNKGVSPIIPAVASNRGLAASVRSVWAQRGVEAPVQVAANSSPAHVRTILHSVEVMPPTQQAMRLASARVVSWPSVGLAASVAERPEAGLDHKDVHVHFRLVASAMAEPLPWHALDARGAMTPGNWAIQVGAYGSADAANEATHSARSHVGGLLGHASTEIKSVQEQHGKLFRARLTGLSRATAEQACEHISRGACIVISPAGQI